MFTYIRVDAPATLVSNDTLMLIVQKLLYLVNSINPLNPKLNPICHLLALLGAHHILHVSRIRVNTVSTHYS